tara:strand:+ start:577 stop:798 length:222 start_codon:yes stop_codon:yes gene_type:complete
MDSSLVLQLNFVDVRKTNPNNVPDNQKTYHSHNQGYSATLQGAGTGEIPEDHHNNSSHEVCITNIQEPLIFGG